MAVNAGWVAESRLGMLCVGRTWQEAADWMQMAGGEVYGVSVLFVARVNEGKQYTYHEGGKTGPPRGSPCMCWPAG